MKRPLRTFRKARARKLVEERGRRGRESDGKNSRVSEMKVRRHCRRKLKLLGEAYEYSRVSNEDDIKGKECSSKLLELNIVCSPWKRSSGRS